MDSHITIKKGYRFSCNVKQRVPDSRKIKDKRIADSHVTRMTGYAFSHNDLTVISGNTSE